MRRRLLLFLFLSAVPLLAQPSDLPAPLYLWAAGDLYVVPASGPLAPPVQLTTGGLVTDPSAAPDLSAVAYRLPAPLALAALTTLPVDGLIAGYDLPMDVVLIRSDGTALPLAVQPDGASFDGTTASTALVRSAPVWSPSGDQVAWVEYPFGAASSRIVAHPIMAGTDAILIDGVPLAGARAPILRWGRAGLLVSAANDQNGLDLIAYAPDGAPVFAARYVPPVGRSIQLVDWVQGAEQTDDRAGVLIDDGTWVLLESDGTTRPASVVRVAEAPGSRRIAFGYLPDFGWYWSAVDPLDPLAAAVDFPASPERMALSPDGRVVASIGYPDAGGVGLWTANSIIALPGTGVDGLYIGGLLWGRTVWQIES